MSSSFLFFSSFVLDGSSIHLLFASLLSSLESLCNHKLGVDNLFVLFLLRSHNFKLSFFQDFHPSLLQSLAAENVKHRLDFLIEVKEFVVTREDLSSFAVLF